MSPNTEPFHAYRTSELKHMLAAYDYGHSSLLLFVTEDMQTLVLSPAGRTTDERGNPATTAAAAAAAAAGLTLYDRADLVRAINARPDTDNVR